MRKLLFLLASIGIVGGVTVAYAAPNFNIFRHLMPETTNTYDLGSPTSTWRNLYVDNCVGCGGSGNSAWTIGSGLIYNATSTDNIGIGTTTPNQRLVVIGNAAIGGKLALGDATIDRSPYLYPSSSFNASLLNERSLSNAAISGIDYPLAMANYLYLNDTYNASTSFVFAADNEAFLGPSSSGHLGGVEGMFNNAQSLGSALVDNLTGSFSGIGVAGTGTSTVATGLLVSNNFDGSHYVPDGYGVSVWAYKSGTPLIDRYTGIFIDDTSSIGTSNYNIRSDGLNSTNAFVGKVLVGTTTSITSARFQVLQRPTDYIAAFFGTDDSAPITGSIGSAGSFDIGTGFGGTSAAEIFGFNTYPHVLSGTVTDVTAGYLTPYMDGGTVTNLTGLSAFTAINGGTATNVYNMRSGNPAAGTATNLYGLYIDPLTSATNKWAIFASGTTPSYFGGSLGINSTTPSASIDLLGTAGLMPFRVASSTGASLFEIEQNGTVGFNTTTPAASIALTGTGGINPFLIASSTGTSMLNVLQNGRVGINTISPGAMLQINNPAGTSGNAFVIASSSGAHLFQMAWNGVASSSGAVYADAGLSGIGLLSGTQFFQVKRSGQNTQIIMTLGNPATQHNDIVSGNAIGLRLCAANTNSTSCSYPNQLVLKPFSSFVGVNTSTPQASLHIYPPASNNVGLIVQATGSQTSNLTQWVNNAGTALSSIDANGRFGFGTTTPISPIHLVSTATTTMTIDSTSVSQGACLELKDADGSGYTYITVNNGVITASTASCK